MADREHARGGSAKFVRWLAVLLYLGVIFTLSAQPDLTAPVHFGNDSDKVYHVLEYFGLGTLLARALTASWPTLWPWPLAALALGIGVVTGGIDEWFQSTVPGRHSTVADAVADTAGVALALLAYGAFRSRAAAARRDRAAA